MGVGKIKLIFLLVIYFAGFATAIYIFSPEPAAEVSYHESKNANRSQEGGVSLNDSGFASNEFAQCINAGMHKCVDFGKAAAWQTFKLIKQKLQPIKQKPQERQIDS
ncbi:MAG: hypothetical protein ACYSRR_04280 [Planctomycetota bacterium]|jgi:hypothetical protein